MNDKKNLDRLFQEKFKDFEVEPNEQAWKNIEAALKGKEKERKVIPLWYRLSGVAAAVLILAFVLNAFLDSDLDAPQNSIVIENTGNPTAVEKSNGVANQDDQQKNPEKKRSTIEEASTPAITDDTRKNGITDTENNIVSSGSKPVRNHNSVSQKNTTATNAVATKSDKKPNRSVVKNAGIVTDYDKAVAHKASRQKKNKMVKNPSDKISENENDTKIAVSGITEQEGSSPLVPAENATKNQKTSIATNQGEQKNTIQNSTNPLASKSVNDAMATVDTKKLDSAAVATAEPNALEELLKENEKEKNVIAETKLNRWQITPQIAPIYFGSTSNGSPIDQQFSNNDKRYDRNMSYGVAVNYAVSKKFNVRTGVNKLTLGYDTNDIIFAAGLQSSNFQSITPSLNSASIQVVSAEGLLPFESSLQGIKAGSISQRMGYIEVPMELSYKLVDDTFGINLIGGVSTLFLNENDVSISATGVNASLGKANNLNDVHFSSNFGVGFKYSFWKSFEFNFEPTLKYQINTFSKNAGDFKPYFVGLYSGLSFKF